MSLNRAFDYKDPETGNYYSFYINGHHEPMLREHKPWREQLQSLQDRVQAGETLDFHTGKLLEFLTWLDRAKKKGLLLDYPRTMP